MSISVSNIGWENKYDEWRSVKLLNYASDLALQNCHDRMIVNGEMAALSIVPIAANQYGNEIFGGRAKSQVLPRNPFPYSGDHPQRPRHSNRYTETGLPLAPEDVFYQNFTVTPEYQCKKVKPNTVLKMHKKNKLQNGTGLPKRTAPAGYNKGHKIGGKKHKK